MMNLNKLFANMTLQKFNMFSYLLLLMAVIDTFVVSKIFNLMGISFGALLFPLGLWNILIFGVIILLLWKIPTKNKIVSKLIQLTGISIIFGLLFTEVLLIYSTGHLILMLFAVYLLIVLFDQIGQWVNIDFNKPKNGILYLAFSFIGIILMIVTLCSGFTGMLTTFTSFYMVGLAIMFSFNNASRTKEKYSKLKHKCDNNEIGVSIIDSTMNMFRCLLMSTFTVLGVILKK